MEEMAASAREDGGRGQEHGRRGCEHYDRGCLLKVTTSLGSSPRSFRRVQLGAGWAKRFGLGLSLRLGCCQDTLSSWVAAVENVFGKATTRPTFPLALYFASKALLAWEEPGLAHRSLY